MLCCCVHFIPSEPQNFPQERGCPPPQMTRTVGALGDTQHETGRGWRVSCQSNAMLSHAARITSAFPISITTAALLSRAPRRDLSSGPHGLHRPHRPHRPHRTVSKQLYLWKSISTRLQPIPSPGVSVDPKNPHGRFSATSSHFLRESEGLWQRDHHQQNRRI